MISLATSRLIRILSLTCAMFPAWAITKAVFMTERSYEINFDDKKQRIVFDKDGFIRLENIITDSASLSSQVISIIGVLFRCMNPLL